MNNIPRDLYPDTGIKLGRSYKLWRGTSETTGTNGAVYGDGLYMTTDKKYARQFGKVHEVQRHELPDNPARFKSVWYWEIWLQKLTKFAGLSVRERNHQYPRIQDFIHEFFPDIDGVQIGTGSDTIIVAWPDEYLTEGPTLKLAAKTAGKILGRAVLPINIALTAKDTYDAVQWMKQNLEDQKSGKYAGMEPNPITMFGIDPSPGYTDQYEFSKLPVPDQEKVYQKQWRERVAQRQYEEEMARQAKEAERQRQAGISKVSTKDPNQQPAPMPQTMTTTPAQRQAMSPLRKGYPKRSSYEIPGQQITLTPRRNLPKNNDPNNTNQ